MKRLGLFAIFLLLLVTPARADFWCKYFNLGCPPVPTFTPVYEKNVTVNSPFGPPKTITNEWYFATQWTAEETCRLMDCLRVTTQEPCDLGGGPNICSAPERMIVFSDLTRNAGLYASFWTRNQDSAWAIKLAKMQLAADRASIKQAARLASRKAKHK